MELPIAFLVVFAVGLGGLAHGGHFARFDCSRSEIEIGYGAYKHSIACSTPVREHKSRWRRHRYATVCLRLIRRLNRSGGLTTLPRPPRN